MTQQPAQDEWRVEGPSFSSGFEEWYVKQPNNIVFCTCYDEVDARRVLAALKARQPAQDAGHGPRYGYDEDEAFFVDFGSPRAADGLGNELTTTDVLTRLNAQDRRIKELGEAMERLRDNLAAEARDLLERLEG